MILPLGAEGQKFERGGGAWGMRARAFLLRLRFHYKLTAFT